MSAVTIDPAVSGFFGAHGGYVAMLALEAVAERVEPDRPPRSLTTHLLAPVRAATVDIAPRIERSGSSMTTATARITQDDDTVALATAAFGRRQHAIAHDDSAMPAVPPPEQCEPLLERPVDAGVNLFVEHRPAAPPLPLTGGDKAELTVWMRRGDDTRVDAASAVFLADSAAPALYGALTEYVAMPSTEIAVHFADPRSDDPWVLARVRNRVARDGYAIEDGELWARDGRLLLHSRQLRRVLAPRA